MVGVPVPSVQFNRSILSVNTVGPSSRSRRALKASVWRLAGGRGRQEEGNSASAVAAPSLKRQKRLPILKTPGHRAQKPRFCGKRLRDYVLTPIYEASTFAEKHLKMEELIPVQSASRYRKTIDDYKLRLKDNPDLKLSEYCKEVHTNYRRVLGWTRRHGISISALKRKASGETAWGLSDTEPGNAFIQFVPSSRLTSASLLGISITFPDGVNLTLQESSVESVISLLTIYQSRHGGAKSCSD